MTEQQAKTKVPDSAVPLVMAFESAPDKNMKLIWIGPVPREGERLFFKGRDTEWVVDRVEWHCAYEVKEQSFERAVKLVLKEAGT